MMPSESFLLQYSGYFCKLMYDVLVLDKPDIKPRADLWPNMRVMLNALGICMLCTSVMTVVLELVFLEENDNLR